MLRKLIRIALALAGLGLLAGLALGFWLKRQIDSGLVEREASRLLEGAAGIQAKFGAIRFGKLGTLGIDVLDVKGPRDQDEVTFRFDLLELDYSVADLFLHFRLKIHGIRLVKPRIHAVVTKMPKLPPRGPDEPRPKVDLAFLEKELVERVTIEDGELEVEDRLEARPLTLTVKALNLDLAFPQAGSPVRFQLSLAPMGGLVTAKGRYSLGTQSGEANVQVNLPDLTFVAPFIEAKNPGLKLSRLGVALSGEITKDRDKIDYALAGRVEPLRVELPPPLKLVVGGAVAVSVKPREVALNELKLEAEGLAPLALSAKLDGFDDPRDLIDPALRKAAHVVADVKLAGLTIASVLPLVPADKLPPALNLDPQGALDVSAHLAGELGNPAITAAVKLAGVKGTFTKPPISGPFEIKSVDLTVDDRVITVHELALSALGVDLALTAQVDQWRTAPAFQMTLRGLDVDVAQLLPHVKDLPAQVTRLALEAHVHLGLQLAAQLGPWLAHQQLQWPRDAKLAGERARALVEAFKGLPPEKLKGAVDGLVKAFGVKFRMDVQVTGAKAHVAEVPGGVVEADLAAKADLDGVEVTQLIAGLPALKAGVRARLLDPLGERKLAAQVVVPVAATVATTQAFGSPAWVSFRELLALKPPPRPLPVQVDGRVRIEIAAVGPLAGGRLPEVGARVEIDAVKVVAKVRDAELVAEIPKLGLEVKGRALKVAEFQVKLPFVTLAASAQAGPFVEPGVVLTVAGLKDLVKPYAIPFAVKVATQVPLDLARAAAALGLDREPKLAKLKPQGTVELSAEASGTAAKTAAQAELKAGVVGVTLVAKARSDDVLARQVDASLDLTAGRLVETVRALAPEVPVEPLDRLPATTELKVTGTLAGQPGEYRLKSDLKILDFAANLGGTVDQLPRPLVTALEGKWTLESVDKLKALFPEQVRAKYDEIKPQFRLAGPIKVTGRGPHHEIVAGVEVSDVHAAWEGYTGPVKLDLDRLAVIARTSIVQGAPAPFNGVADVEAKGGTVVVKGKTIPFEIPLSKVAFAPDRVSTEKLDLKVLDQDIILKMDFSRDMARAQRIDAEVSVPGLDLDHLVRALGVPDVQVNGRVGLKVTARGPLEHPELIEPAVDLTIPLLDVKHPYLKGLPLVMTNGRVQVTRDDVIIPDAAAWQIKFGANQFPFPIAGSVKEMAKVPNLFKADPKIIGPRILARIGGEKKITALLGEEQVLRLIGDKLYKVLINIKITDRPDTWQFKGALAPDDTKLFKEHTHEIVEKYTILAKQQLAEQMGFKKAVHGEENYKFLRIEKVGVTILDQGFNMVYPQQIPFWRLTVTPAEW